MPAATRATVRLSLPIAMAYVPLGMALGLMVVTSGLAWWWAPVSALLIYAGSAEFLAVGLITGGVGFVQVVITSLVVNARHVFYGLSFPLHRIRHPLARAYGVWGLTDEVYAVTSTSPGKDLAGRDLTILQVLCQLYWVFGATAGAVLAGLLPSRVTGFEFALVAMFVILFVDAVRENPDLRLLTQAAVSIVVAFAVDARWPGLFLVAGLGCYLLLVTLDHRHTTPTAPVACRASDHVDARSSS